MSDASGWYGLQPETAAVLQNVTAERMRQEIKWNQGGKPGYGRWGYHDDQHGPRDWSAFIVEHLGRAVRAAEQGEIRGYRNESYREQMVRVAALAVAAVEAVDRATQVTP